MLENQLMDFDLSIAAWTENYEVNEQQVELLKSIYLRVIDNPRERFSLTAEEIDMIGTSDEEGLQESKQSFAEIGIGWQE